MISHKNTTKVVGVVMVICVSLCILAMIFSQKVVEVFGSSTVAMQYESVLFDTDEPIQIAIQMEEDEWEDMLDKATAEEYYACDVVINGHKICNVGIRPKGNTSLSAIAMDPETDRFSLKLEFDHYVEGQTCFGLDKLILNNNYADATNMKEAVVYDMYSIWVWMLLCTIMPKYRSMGSTGVCIWHWRPWRRVSYCAIMEQRMVPCISLTVWIWAAVLRKMSLVIKSFPAEMGSGKQRKRAFRM